MYEGEFKEDEYDGKGKLNSATGCNQISINLSISINFTCQNCGCSAEDHY